MSVHLLFWLVLPDFGTINLYRLNSYPGRFLEERNLFRAS